MSDAETSELMDMDAILNPPEMDLLEPGPCKVEVDGAQWNDEKGYIMLFLKPLDTDLEVDNIVECLSFPKKSDPKRTHIFKSSRIKAWIAGTGIAPGSIQDPDAWLQRTANIEVKVEVSEEYGTSNKVKDVHPA